ncbi:MAG TPA: glycerophosphodiester phosphodiesterase family protein [Propionicimonas sp.]|uniref:glycerophosphodiester phosphodiesterase n=1 Tax=Propionicimonas sp. TaxID=1955623 RepID=UPI002F404267
MVPPLVRALAVATATACLALALPSAAPATTLGKDGKPIVNAAGSTLLVVAHRGGAFQWPENSVEAFLGSAEAGYDGIETDLAWTKDGQPVMSHNDVLPDRCTGAGQSIHRLTAAQVAEVRCADLAGEKVVPIPTFAQLAKVLADHPDIALHLDLKSYPGQSFDGKRTYATRAMALLTKYGLLGRTKILTFYWSSMLPVIRKASRSIFVTAYDGASFDLDLARVRLADKLGANAYAPRMVHTSAYLARYVRSKGMDVVPFEVFGAEQLAFSIHYGGKTQYLLTDEPANLQRGLITNTIAIDPVAVPTTTTLPKRVVVGSGTYRAGTAHYPRILGKAVPTADRPMLDTVTIAVTVSRGPGKGTLRAGPRSASFGSVSVRLPKGTKTLTLKVPVGNNGDLRISTSRTVKVTVRVVGYTRVRFPDSSVVGTSVVGQQAPVVLAGA